MAIGPIATAIAEVSKVIGKWMTSSQRRKMVKAIEAGEKYIQTNEDSALKKERKQKLLRHYKKRFFKYN